jgi:hypothetical protein
MFDTIELHVFLVSSSVCLHSSLEHALCAIMRYMGWICEQLYATADGTHN